MSRKIKKICIAVLAFTMLLNPCSVYAGPLDAKPETENNIESESGSSEKNPDENKENTEENIEDKTESEGSEDKTENKETEEEQISEETDGSTDMILPEEVDVVSDAAEAIEPRVYQGKAENDTGNTANVVVFVEFADTVHNHFSSDLCYLQNPKLTKLFQGDDKNQRALKKYLQNISYNQLEVANIFPQYDAAADKIHSYTLKYGLDHYADSKNGDTEIIEEIADILASSGQISSGISLDRNNDGYVDNLMIVVPCESGSSNTKYNGHMSHY